LVENRYFLYAACNLLGKTVANIFALFFTTEPYSWPIRYCTQILQKVLCLFTITTQSASQTDGRTDEPTDRKAISTAERSPRNAH